MTQSCSALAGDGNVMDLLSSHDDKLTPFTATIFAPSGAAKPESTSQMVMFLLLIV